MNTALTIIGILGIAVVVDISTLPLVARNAKKKPGSMMLWSLVQMCGKNLLIVVITLIAFSR